MFEKGKMYLCLVCPYDNFTEGREYLAITDDELIDDYGSQVQIRNDNCRFKKAEPIEKIVSVAKQKCQDKILAAINEFECSTGFNVTDINCDTKRFYAPGVGEFENKHITIVISL